MEQQLSTKDWENFLETRYNAKFSLDGVELVESAAKDKSNTILNTRDFLQPLLRDSKMLRSLEVKSSFSAHMGSENPPYHEEICERDKGIDPPFGFPAFSRYVDQSLEEAIHLARSTDSYSSVNRWHIAAAVLSSNGPGIEWQLSEGGTDSELATEALLRNLKETETGLYEAGGRALEREFQGQVPKMGMGRNAAREAIERNWKNFLSNYQWSQCVRSSLEGIRDIALDMVADAPNYGSGSTHIPISEVPFRLTPEAIFYGILLHGTRQNSQSSDSPGPEGELSRFLANAFGAAEEWLRSTIIHSLRMEAASDSEKTEDSFILESADVLIVLEIARQSANGFSDGILATRHVIMALVVPSDQDDGLTFVDLFLHGYEPEVLVSTLRDYFATNAIVKKDKQGEASWIPLIDRLEEFVNQLPESQPITPTLPDSRGTFSNTARDALKEELGVGIEELSKSLQTLFETTPANTDLIFALYGPWGRGKTTLMNMVRDKLGKSELEDYAFVDFSAWKYPTRPEVWVHLYETVAAQASRIEDPSYAEGQRRNSCRELRMGFRCGILKAGWLPIYIAVICLALTQVPLLDAYAWIKGFLGVSGFAALLTFLGKATSIGRSMAQRYLALPDHSSQLGMQAVIGKDLDHLLHIWIEPKQEESTKDTSDERSKDQSTKPRPSELDIVDFRWRRKGSWYFWGMLPTLLIAFALTYIPPLSEEKAPPSESITYQAISEFPPDQEFTPDSASAALQKGRIVTIEETIQVGKENASNSDPGPLDWAKTWFLTKERIILFLLMALVIGFGILVIPKPKTKSKLLLVIDDLDRCRPDQMLSVIESLRLFLDNPGMRSRLQIAMLVDDRLLGHALLRRAKDDGIALEPKEPHDEKENMKRRAEFRLIAATYIREQREKLFLAELALSDLSPEDLEDIAIKYLPTNSGTSASEEHESSDENAENTQGDFATQESSPSSDPSPAPLSKTPDSNQGAEGIADPPTVESGSVLSENESSRTPEGVSNKEGEDQEPKSNPERRFHDDEIPPLRDAIISMGDHSPTPRQLRTFLARYQLARLLLDNQKIDFKIQDLINGITHELRLGHTKAEQREVRQVARIVVCPPSVYTDDLRAICDSEE